jgi:hypothetical protein
MTTTTQPAFMSSSPEYQGIMNEIKKSIDKNDALFKTIQQSNYPDAGTYSSDLLNYKITSQVSDLTEARQQIWDYLQKKYIENTKLRTYYFTEIRKLDNYSKDLQPQKQALIDSIENNSTEANTSIRQIKNEKYMFNKMEYYLFLYKILVFIQIAILAVITLSITGFIPRTTGLIVIIILLIASIAFVAYYVFFVNIGRNRFSWTKFEHSNNDPIKADQCADAGPSDSDKQKALADAQVASIIAANQSSAKCST